MKNRDVAVGGAKVSDILNGCHGVIALLAHITNDPDIDYSDALAPETTSMIDRVEALDPDIGFTTDLLGNDLDAAVVQPDDLDPTLITPIDEVAPMLQTMMAAARQAARAVLHRQHAVVDLRAARGGAAAEARRRGQGHDGVRRRRRPRSTPQTDAYNQALLAAVAPYPNLHIVDFKQYVADVRGGVTVGGEPLTIAHWGGLISLDDLHLTDTGYALYAQKLPRRHQRGRGTWRSRRSTSTPCTPQDALAPAKLRAAGYTCVPAAM